MRNRGNRWAVAAAGFALLSLALVAPRGARAIVNCETATAPLDGEEQAMLALINGERVARGIPPLVSSPALKRAAAWKSGDTATSVGAGLSHTDSLGRTPAQRARDCGYPSSVAENIAYGYGSAAATLNAWMGSPGHRANILNAGYRAAGLGLVGAAWTADFGFYDDSGMPEPAAAPPTVAPPPPTPTVAAPTPPPVPVAGVSVVLAASFNLVTYAGTVPLPVPVVLASIIDRVDGVYGWNAAAGKWERYLPGAPAYVNNIAMMQPGHAYAVELSAPATWTY